MQTPSEPHTTCSLKPNVRVSTSLYGKAHFLSLPPITASERYTKRVAAKCNASCHGVLLIQKLCEAFRWGLHTPKHKTLLCFRIQSCLWKRRSVNAECSYYHICMFCFTLFIFKLRLVDSHPEDYCSAQLFTISASVHYLRLPRVQSIDIHEPLGVWTQSYMCMHIRVCEMRLYI